LSLGPLYKIEIQVEEIKMSDGIKSSLIGLNVLTIFLFYLDEIEERLRYLTDALDKLYLSK